MASPSRDEKQKRAAQEAMELLNPTICRIFERYLNRYFKKNFHGLRVARDGEAPVIETDHGLVVYCNHASWWDPLVMYYLARALYSDRKAFGPIDATALEKYKFMRKIGLFPVEQDSSRGSVHFLNVSHGLLKEPMTSIWLTPQGEFADARVRPVTFKPGLAHLARDCGKATFLPMAVEYCFWNESKPELLLRFGTPIHSTEPKDKPIDDWQAQLQMALQTAQDKLAMDAMSRDPERFTEVLQGSVGVGVAYDGWRRIKAWARGRSFSAAHEDDKT
ncbi:MAG: lysophospholipid acyltransferase family protein [Pseudomonadota bacterium]